MAAPRHQDRRPPRGPRARSFLWLATVLIVVAYGTLVGTGQPPSARQGAAMAYDAAHQQIVLFGGSNNASGGLGDTWTWDGSDWTEQSPAHSPGASFSSMAYDAANGTVVLFDGNTWTWDGSDWTQQSPLHTPSSSGPIAYDAATQTVDLFGSDGETWTWDGSDWTEQDPA